MIVGTIFLQARSDKTAEFMKAAETVTKATETLAGCERFRFYRDIVHQDTFMLYQSWKDRAAFDAFFVSQTRTDNINALAPCMQAPPTGGYFTAEQLEESIPTEPSN